MKNFHAHVINYIHYVKNHHILVDPRKRFYGILYTLLAWFLIAFSLTFFSPSSSQLPFSIEFFIVFSSSTIFLFLLSKIGHVSLRVSSQTDKDQKTHLDYSARKRLIFIRGLLAVISYVGLSIADRSMGIVNSSAIFGADALVYALLMWWILKEKRSFLDWIGILIATIGIAIPFVVNSLSESFIVAFSGGTIGLLSSVLMSIIFFINSIIVRHEPATRVAFYQSFIGTLASTAILIISLFFVSKWYQSVSTPAILSAIWSGLFYGLALLLFFRAFLYTEVILIAITGYLLDPFSVFLNWIQNHSNCTFANWLTIGLITCGTAILYYEEQKHAKKNKKQKVTQPIYEPTITDEYEKNDQQYQKGAISTETYLARRKLFNDLLFKISEEMIDTDVKKIELEKGQVYFSLFDFDLKLECDDDLQSTPLEILNFGSYWKEELAFIMDLCPATNTIVDFNAQIGWLSLNLAKKFPKSSIFAFESVTDHFSHLVRNIANNDCSNAKPFNIRLSNRQGKETFYLLPEERVLTPEKNALIYTDLSNEKCTGNFGH